MSDPKPLPDELPPPEAPAPSRHMRYVVAAVLILILVGGTAPWWVGKLGPEPEHESATSSDDARTADTTAKQPAATPTPAGAESSAETSPKKSLTEAELAETGNAIINFTVEELSGLSLKLKVSYACNEEHGQKVMLGGVLRGVESECTPVRVENPTKGTVRLSITATNPGLSKRLDIYLYEDGHADEPFAVRRFPFEQRFRDRAP